MFLPLYIPSSSVQDLFHVFLNKSEIVIIYLILNYVTLFVFHYVKCNIQEAETTNEMVLFPFCSF